MKKGLQEGEQKAKEDIASRLLKKGMDIESVAELAALSKEDVIRIQRKLLQ